MKAVMISIKPKWVKKIAYGEKTIEVRKSYPKLQTPFKVYIYCTKGNRHLYEVLKDGDEDFCGNIYHGKPAFIEGDYPRYGQKVLGEFVCDKIEDFSRWEYDYSALLRHIDLYAGTNGNYKFLSDYLKGQKKGYGWHISDLKIYDKPKEISEFHHFCAYPNNTCKDCAIQKLKPHCHYGEGLTRPPQSWCYVEEKDQ